jgi:hypothetical protein
LQLRASSGSFRFANLSEAKLALVSVESSILVDVLDQWIAEGVRCLSTNPRTGIMPRQLAKDRK